MRKLLLWGCVVLVISGHAAAQAPSAPLGNADADQVFVRDLREHGLRVEAPRFTAWFAKESSPDARHRVREFLAEGIPAIEAFVKHPQPWQGSEPLVLEYYFPAARFVSHANPDGQVFIPLMRLEDGTAPLLHETVHALLRSGTKGGPTGPRPAWLSEGFADYAAKTLAQRTGLPEGDPLRTGRIDQLDSTCTERLGNDPYGILAFMGKPGRPAALADVTLRPKVAPVFYGCAASFVKFIVERHGLPMLLEVLGASREEEALVERTGGPVEALVQAWAASRRKPL